MVTLIATTFRRRTAAREQLALAFQAMRPELVGTLFYLLGNHEDAQDAAQEAFVKCWRSDQVGKVRNFRAWIFRVGLNAAKDLQRNAYRRRARPLDQACSLDDDSQPSAAEVLEHHEDLERLQTALFDLRREEKEVFLLRQNGDLTYEQIACVCRRPVGTVKTQMRSALQKLRRVLRSA
jgi:RNA polymerase sigma-70 factor (ECF subfamily)